MRHFESRILLKMALLAALGYSAVACSSDSDHGPPVGAPNAPIVVTEGGGAGGSANVGQGAANNAGETGNPGFGGSLNTGGSFTADPSAGAGNFGSPGTAGSTFGASGGTGTFGGSF